MSRLKTDRMAFTLIEVLIVVTIIAILVAIAVPNFMGTQTRTKVSRVRTDMAGMALSCLGTRAMPADRQETVVNTIESIGIYTDLISRPEMIPFFKACGYNVYQCWDMGFVRPTDSLDEYHQELAEGIVRVQAAGFKVYVFLSTNMNQKRSADQQDYEMTFDPADQQLMRERLEYVARSVCRLKMADGFTIAAGDPGGHPNAKPGQFIEYSNDVKDIVHREAPGAQLGISLWSISYWDHMPSPFALELWDREVTLSREMIDRPDLFGSDVHVEFPLHNYYRSLALKLYDEAGQTPELFPSAEEVQMLKDRGVKRLWGWPYFITDECDDGYDWTTAGLSQSETRYIKQIVDSGRRVGLNGMICNAFGSNIFAEILNLYAFARFCKDPGATPEEVIRDFAGMIAEPRSVEELVSVIKFVENHSTWQAGLPEQYRLPNFEVADLKTAKETFARLERVAVRDSSPLPIGRPPAAYIEKLKERLRLLALEEGQPVVESLPLAGEEKMIGMYVHQHWPYHHPYAARTWTYEDWCGYADGLRRLGYNTLLIWVAVEVMPKPLTPSDQAELDKMARVIDALHEQYGMKVYLALCPNVIGENVAAGGDDYQHRHFFHCDLRVNPADPEAVDQMIRWREKLLRPLRNIDGVTLIDSDPSGYPGSNNKEFIGLFAAHRKMLDRLRPGIEIVYWMHAGWPAYSRLYATNQFAWGTDEEFIEAISLLKALNPEPWGLANGQQFAKQLGVEDRVLNFRYGAIEGEPSFPMTNFGTRAYEVGSQSAPRGVFGNAQTHCVQLPNTFAFVRGALGKSLTDEDYIEFADDLIVGQGRAILNGWKALEADAQTQRATAEQLEALSNQPLTVGPLKGLLFGDPQRFLMDLVYQLRLKAAEEEFCTASENGLPVREPLRRFVEATEAWQNRHGYQGARGFSDRLRKALDRLDSPHIKTAFNPEIQARTPYGRHHEGYYLVETFSSRFLQALRSTMESMP